MTASNAALNIAARLGTLLFSGLFALTFGGGGVYFGVLPLARTAGAAWEVRSWQAVPAQVLSSKLVSNRSSDSTTYLLQARYRYTFGAHTREASRIGLDASASADNIGDWHQRWHARLRSARDRGQTITVWVDPANPSRSVIDPDIRWAQVIFHLPFALVFTGVGLAALWVFLRALTGRDSVALRTARRRRTHRAEEAEPTAGVADTRSFANRGHRGVWFFAFFWCGISFPMAALIWMTGSHWWPKVFMLIFVAIGVGLLTLAWRQSARAWRHAGTDVQFVPAEPGAGEAFEVSLAMSSRAMQHLAHGARRLRLAQYRVDDAGSGTPERQVEAFEKAASTMPDLSGGERWHARFELPADAPAHGGRRSGERVDWRLEILTPDGVVEVSYEVPVSGSASSSDLDQSAHSDHFGRQADWGHEEAIPLRNEGRAFGDPVVALPHSVRVTDGVDAWEMRFRQNGWRWAAAVALGMVAVLSGLWWKDAPGMFWADALASGLWWAVAVLWLFALHAGTRQWRLRMHDDGVEREVASCIWRRTVVVPLVSLDHLFSKLSYTQSSGQVTTAFHALHAREAADGASVPLTPGLSGAASVVAVGQALRAARDHRVGRFTPGAVRRSSSSNATTRPAWGWMVWALLLTLLAVGPVHLPFPG